MKRTLKSAVRLSVGVVILTLSLGRLLGGQPTLKIEPSNPPLQVQNLNLSLPEQKLTFKLQVQSGSNGVAYLIQASTNLVDWKPVITVRPQAAGSVSASPIPATNSLSFFRLLQYLSVTDTNPPVWTNGVGNGFTMQPPATLVAQWKPAVDDVGVAEYRLYLNGQLLTNVSGLTLSYQFTVNLHQPSNLRIQAADASGNSTDILSLVYLPGDGLVAVSDDSGRVYLIQVQPDGSFGPAKQIASFNNYPRGVGVGDFDRDGILDIITGGASGDTLTPFFLKGKGDGTFAPPVALPTTTGANSYMMDATVGDFDSDGNLDFVVNGNNRYVFFYWGKGDGTFTLEVKDWGDYGRGMVTGDFNEDGREDIVRGEYSGPGRLRLFLSNGDRTFTETNNVGQYGSERYGVAAGDFDEDGHLDVIANNGGSGDMVFYKGLGDGTFTSVGTNGLWSNLDVNTYAGLDAFDYNGDGHLDLVMATANGQAYFWPGQGDGTFGTNRITLATGLSAAFGISAPPRPPRVQVRISPTDPVTNLNGKILLTAVGSGVAASDFFLWTFGDQGTNPVAWTFTTNLANLGPTTSHAYTNEGRFLIRLWHTSASGVKSARGTWATVKGAPPVADPGGPYALDEGAAKQLVWTAALDGSKSTDDFGIVSYVWAFGDGSMATNTGPKVTHSWTNAGVWNVTLTVLDAAGQSDAKSTTVTFTPGNAPVASITGPGIVNESSAKNGVWTTTFYATNSVDDFGLWKYEWQFGDGKTGTGSAPQTTYSAVGTYVVKLVVYDHAGQTNATTQTVTVKANQPPVPLISGPHLLTEAVATNGLWYGAWDGLASTDDFGVYRWEWDFGDGAKASGAKVDHNYTGVGVYPLTLTVYDFGNQTVTATANVIVVAGDPPVARITASTLTPEGAEPITFSGQSSTDDYGMASYRWLMPPRRFSFSGQYLDVKQWSASGATQDDQLFVTGNKAWGQTGFFSLATQMERGGALEGTIGTPTGEAYAMVGLKNTDSSFDYHSLVYAVYFNNGEVRIYEYGNNRGAATNYTRGNAYDYRIETKPNAGARYYLRSSGTGDAFVKIFETDNYNDVAFRFGADVYSGTFSFDDLVVDHVVSPYRDLTAPVFPGGDVFLQVVDNARQTNTAKVTITPMTGAPPVAVISGPTNAQSGVEVAFNGYLSTDDHALASYSWDFGDRTPLVFGPAVTHRYNSAGTYTNVLTVRDYANQASAAALVITITGSNALVCIPWRIINGIIQPHEVYAGKTNTLKAVARGVPAPFDFIWDFGDNSGSITNTVTNTAALYNLEALHAYQGSDGTPVYATIRLVQTNGTVLSDTYFMVLRPKTLDLEMKVAIDEGLWYLHKIQTRYDLDANNKGGYWTYSAWSSSHINVSASAVQAFAINGHLMTGDSSQDPYVETVQRGINYLLSRLTTINIGPQTYGDPDGNHNGIALTSPDDRPPYEVGPVMDALVAAGRPELVAPVGGPNVKGRLFRDLMQDLVDVYAWGQSDGSYGGWVYGWNDREGDNSVNQWAAIGFMAAERYWGIATPDWVKQRNLLWVPATAGGSGYGYRGPGDGEATTPSAMVQLAWAGVSTTNALWLHGENFLAKNWSALMSYNNVYSTYAITKALRSANPPVHNLSANGKDWYRDPIDGMARTTIDRQRADGSWLGSGRGYDNDLQMATAWSTIILSSSLFQQGPVAVVSVKPNPSAVGYPVIFDARGSYHQHPAYKVIDYRWVFDASKGVDFDHPDATGALATNIYGSFSTNTVWLQVRDNATPQLSDSASVVVRTTIPPYPPTADAGGPYVACVGQDIHLDGSGSFTVDEAAGNFIRSWDWETAFQTPLQFKDASGEQAVITNGFATAGQHQIGLRVINANSLVYTNVALPDMTAEAFTTAYVYNRVIPDLRGRPKGSKCQLTWTKAGDYGVVMRSTNSPDRGFAEVGRTDSSFATFLDENIDYNTEYYYRVYAYRNGQADVFGVSDPVYVVSPPRSFDEHAPHFQSTPLRLAQVGVLYQVTLDAKDLENKPLYFAKLAGPTNLTVGLTNGVIEYTPTADQIGSQFVSFQVTNNIGRDVLSYSLFVFPATNNPPVANANGPYTALTGQDIQFSSAGTGDPDQNTLRYYWNFGDGTTATEANPVHGYGGIGDYLVTLFVNDGFGGTASSKTHVVITRPNRPPVVVMPNGAQYTVRLGELVTVDGSGSYDLDGNPLTYAWTWGDGTRTNNNTGVAPHLYATGGSYPGSFTVTDNQGGSTTNGFEVTVMPANQPPVVSLNVDHSAPYVMASVTLDATGTTDPENDPLTFEWDFGDRAKTTGPLVTHVFRQINDFSVVLKVSDNHGGVSLATQLVHVVNAPPVFTSTPPLLWRAGTNYTYTPTLTDADNDARSFQLVQGPATMACDTNTGTLTWLPGTNDIGSHAVVLRATDAGGDSVDQDYALVVSTPLGPQIDLEPTHIAMTNVTVESQTLALSGTVRVYFRNQGTDEVPVPFTVSVFTNAQANGSGFTNAQGRVGYGNFPAGLPAGGAGWVEMAVNGQALFKDAPLYAFVDSENVVPEYDKLNNLKRSGFDAPTNQPPVVDLSAASLLVDRTALPSQATLTARLGNSGYVSVPTNVPMAFYDGDPQAGGSLIGVGHSLVALAPGQYQDLSVLWPSPTIASHTVYVVAGEPGNGTYLFNEINRSNNTFSTVVDLAAVEPPVADAGPDQSVNAGDTVILNGRASHDPQSKSLTYRWSILSIPVGSRAQLSSTNIVNPSIISDKEGQYAIQLVVNNGIKDSAPATVTVTAVDTNIYHPPTITSKPSFQGMVNVLYTYQVLATDPQGKPLTFRFMQSPAGMTINATNGLVQWIPTNTGSFFVQVAADGVGGSAWQSYTLAIVAFTNLPPQFTSTPVAVAAPDAPYSYTATAVDPNRDTVSFALTTKPSGMSINAQSGAITWTPTTNQLGGNPVAITASDGKGGTATQTFNLVILTGGASGLVVQSIPDQTISEPTAFTAIPLDNYILSPNYAANQIAWKITGANKLAAIIDSNRIATITYAPGTLASEQLTFLATDPAGKSAYAASSFTVRGVDHSPVAALANLSDTDTTSIGTGFFELKGTADDPDAIDAVDYRVLLYDANGARVGDVTPKPVNAAGWHEGRVLAGGSLGQLDFTVVQNGAYTLSLEVRGGNQTVSALASIALSSQLKIGQVKFSQQDLIIPASHTTLMVLRSYDSLNVSTADFGYSWTYSVSDLGLTINEQRVDTYDILDDTKFSLRVGGSRDVTINMPDTGKRITFTYSLGGGGMFKAQAIWTAPPGVNATLVPIGSPYLVKLFSLPAYWEAAGLEVDVENFDFPGFILTLSNGTQYRIDREDLGDHYLAGTGEGLGIYVHAYGQAYLTKVTDPSGEHTDFVRKGTALQGIDHYTATNKTRSLVFQRDAQNRITAIFGPDRLDNLGNPVGPADVTYSYDQAGNLEKVNKLLNASGTNLTYTTTTYVYGNPRFPHFISEIKDDRGVSPIRMEYDSDGHLVATIDAYGHRTEISRDISARTETVFDRLGNPTVIAYDQRGYVIARTDPLGRTTRFTDDDAGHTTSVTDPLGNTTLMDYDAAGHLTSMTDPLGNRTSYAYDAAGHIVSVTDPLGNSSTNTYDAQGNLIRVRNAYGLGSQFQYDAQNRLTGIIDALGQTNVQTHYDSSDNISQVTTATGLSVNSSYDAKGNQTSQNYQWVNPDDPNDVRQISARTEYDSAGHPVTTVSPLGLSTTTTFNEFGKVASAQDASGAITTYIYDILGNPIKTIYPDGSFVQAVYDANGRLVVTDDRHLPDQPANGTHTLYDAAGQVIGQERLSNVVIAVTGSTNNGATLSSSSFVSSAGVLYATGKTYDLAGRLIAATNSQGLVTSYEYDAASHNTAIINSDGNRTEFEYDATGHRTLIRDALKREVHYLYNSLGQLVQTIFPDGSSVRTTYDEAGRKVSEANSSGQARDYEYDSIGRKSAVVMAQISDPEATNALVQPRYEFAYDAYGNQKISRDPKGRETRSSYDELNRLISRTLPLGQTQSNLYDAQGRLFRVTDSKGQFMELAYDSFGRVTNQNLYAAGAKTPSTHVAISYDAIGRLSTVADARGTTRTAYDYQNQLIQLDSPEGSIHYAYDVFGRRVRTWTAHSDLRYAYDSAGRSSSVTVIQRNGQILAAPETTLYTYDVLGRRASTVLPNGVTARYQYNNLDRLILLTYSNAASGTFASYAYTHNMKGLKTSVIEVRSASGVSLSTNLCFYAYDALNRLVGETNRYGTNGYIGLYSYDLVGNRLKREVTVDGQTLTTTYTYDANDRLLVESNLVAASIGAGAGGTVIPLRMRDTNGTVQTVYRSQPSAWCYYFAKSIPFAVGLAFLLPILLAPLRHRRRIRVLTADLCPQRALLPRCLAGFLAALVALMGFDTRVLADEAAIYASLSTGTWGMGGSVSNYQYDDNGSLTRKVTTGPKPETVDYAYTLLNQLSAVIHTTQATGQTNITTTFYTYDQSGNRVRSESHTRANGSETMGSTNIFLIDPFNRTGFAQILEEYSALGSNPTVSYTIGDEVISQTRWDGNLSDTEFFLCDGHGSTRQLCDGSGTVTERYAYDAYGMMLGGNPTTAQPAGTRLLYTGQQFDTNLQQYHLRARDYDPSNGRFTSMDPDPGSSDDPPSLHRYAYTHGDPVNFIDPSGQQDLLEMVMVVALIGIIASYGVVPMISLLLTGKFLPDAAILGLNLTVSVPLGIPMLGSGGFAIATVLGVVSGLAIGPLLFAGAFSAAGYDVTGIISRAITKLDKAKNGFGISLSFELVGDVRDKSLSAWIAAGPSFGIGSDGWGFSVTGYVGAVWNTPQYEDYAGPFWSIGATVGEVAGLSQSVFTGSGFTQWGVATGITAPVTVPLSGGISWTKYFLWDGFRTSNYSDVEHVIRWLLVSPTTTIWANWLLRELYGTPQSFDPNHKKVTPLPEDPVTAILE